MPLNGDRRACTKTKEVEGRPLDGDIPDERVSPLVPDPARPLLCPRRGTYHSEGKNQQKTLHHVTRSALGWQAS